MKYYQIFISAETKKEAQHMLDSLLAKKLILGGPILQGPAKFWWKGEIVKMDYCYILSYTTEKQKGILFDEMKKISSEEAPMVSLLPFEGNPDLLRLIDETLG